MLKAKSGDRLRSESQTAQVRELLCKGVSPQHLLSDPEHVWVGDGAAALPVIAS
jgi:hypothetical protein